MRKLSDNFFNCLKSGFLSGITEAVKQDPDLNLEIREGYINVYYKGNSLLKLDETKSRYKAKIDKKFLKGVNLPLDFNKDTVEQFTGSIPFLKQNIINVSKDGKRSLEIEYEQMIIRANNLEAQSKTEYLIVDRQYAENKGRFDLTGIFWDRANHRKNQEVPLCLMEVKFALNPDIKDVHHQLARYYETIKSHATEFSEEMQDIFRQKLELGLYQQSMERIEVLKTLSFSKDINQFQFILILVDYNPNSKKLNLENLAKLPFANQVRILFGGFAMWQQNVKPLSDYLS
ncbi:hypothetical protein ANAEL_05751 [Anaerolineales bacterium]|nr:hypothetical protein ANAEL_05751 [Anaerolineales bacterium]